MYDTKSDVSHCDIDDNTGSMSIGLTGDDTGVPSRECVCCAMQGSGTDSSENSGASVN